MKVKSIKGRLVRMILIFVLVFSLLLGSTCAIMMSSDSISKANTELENLAVTFSSALDGVMDSYKVLAKGIVASYEFSSAQSTAETRAEFIKRVSALYADDYSIVSCGYTDLNGLSNTGVDLSQQDFFKETVAGETCIHPSVQFAGSQDYLIVISTPIITNSVISGVFYLTIPSTVITNKMKEIDLGESGQLLLIRKDGLIICDSSESFNNINIFQAAMANNAYQNTSDVLKKVTTSTLSAGTEKYKDKDGVRRFCGYATAESFEESIIVVDKTQNSYLAALNKMVGTTILVSVLLLVAAFFAAMKVSNNIVNPIKACRDRMELMSEGDLYSECPKVKRKDEVADLAVSIEKTVENLSAMVRDTNVVLNEVTTGSEQVSFSSQALAQGATEQASAIEELSNTFTEITEKVTETSRNADKARELSAEIQKQVQFDNEKMGELINAMSDISNASKEIHKIIKAVDDIAFQTNILALNASVEAARAGAAGKGFAVVADEVRNLASRCANAVNDTTRLIENTLGAIDNGSKINTEVADVLTNIVGLETECKDLIEHIADACDDEATSIQQASAGVDQISMVIQSNSSSAEESAAASITLSEQADILKRSAMRFKLSPEDEATVCKCEENKEEKEAPASKTPSTYQNDIDDKY